MAVIEHSMNASNRSTSYSVRHSATFYNTVRECAPAPLDSFVGLSLLQLGGFARVGSCFVSCLCLFR